MKRNIKLLFTSLTLLTCGISACSGVNPSIVTPSSNSKFVESVTFDVNYLSLDIGDTYTITPTVKMKEGHEAAEVSGLWKTSKPNVCKVEEGLITTLSAGSASITYLVGYKMASCTVVVNGGNLDPTHEDPQPTPATITINAASKTLVVGESYQLIASTNDGAAITWKSSDETIATVSENGLVLAVAPGEVDITASANEKSAKCHVTITDSSIEPEPGDEYPCTVYFFLDYNNVDENDKTGTKLLGSFGWYGNLPISQSGKVPADPTTPADPAFPYFVGWSSHTIIDSADDLWDMEKDTIGNEYFFYLYGIWSDVPKGGFIK